MCYDPNFAVTTWSWSEMKPEKIVSLLHFFVKYKKMAAGEIGHGHSYINSCL